MRSDSRSGILTEEKLLQIIDYAARKGDIVLDLSKKGLRRIPPEIGKLTNLTRLSLNGNKLTSLPSEIGQLKKLRLLFLGNNQLKELPPEIGQLTNLSVLALVKNQLTALPPEIGLLKKLEILVFHGNPIVFPPPEIVRQGTLAVLAHLREHLQASRDQWVSKLLVVGEGGVGKTSLLRALAGKSFDPLLPSTHGLEMSIMELEHPEKRDVTMQLKTWDFGGQEIYHATHQFFLTNRSLFLLVWNTRHGYRQGKLYYWLDTIQAKAPESPILLVATHLDERKADLPFKDLRQKYPQIVGQYNASNRTGTGIEALRRAITDRAAELPLMGETWPAAWLDVAETIRAREEKYITSHELWDKMRDRKVSGVNARVLAQWLHELGDILFFQDVKELEDIVILKPLWVTEYISQVLESDEVIKHAGLLTRDHRDELWHDIEPSMRDHFLHLMECFDLSYPTQEDREVSLVVERLPLDPPDYREKWASIQRDGPSSEISMKFMLNTIQAGIPTWFIARSHRFTTGNHWRSGALFSDSPQETHLALVEAFPHERCLQLTVRGPHPQNFFALLRDGLELTLERFPGLKVERLLPCPGHECRPCSHEFGLDQLLNRLEEDPSRFHVECPEADLDIDIRSLLFGLAPGTFGDVRIKIEKSIIEKGKPINELIVLLQREFLKSHQDQQRNRESHCPNVFAIRQLKIKGGSNYLIHLYCQAPGCWHPVEKGGYYAIDSISQLAPRLAPHLKKMLSPLKYAPTSAGPWTKMAPPQYEKLVKYDLLFMEEILKALHGVLKPGISDSSHGFGEGLEEDGSDVNALQALRRLLDMKDPPQDWGGLRKVLTPEGHYLWLCEYHARDYAQ